MKAAVHAGAGRFEIADAPDPTPGPGELVIRVRSCGICGSDLKAAPAMPQGIIMGHEFCGEVTAAGSDVRDRWKDGDLVASMPLSSCGRCRACLAGDVAHCEAVVYQGLGAMAGGFAEYAAVSAATTFLLPKDVGEHGALVEPLAVGLHAVTTARLRPEESVLIIGGGAVGSNVLVWAGRLGAGTITVSDPSPSRRDAALRLGATSTHDPASGPLTESFDVVVECVGATGLAQSGLDHLKVHGRLVIAGVCTTPDPIQHVIPLMKEAEIRYAVYYTTQEFRLASRLLADGQVDAGLLITGETTFDDFDATFSALSRGDLAGKHILRPQATAIGKA